MGNDPADLAETLANEGGFSLSPAGRWARSGTMVSRAGTETVHAGIASPSQISDYQTSHAAEFSRRGHYMGAWVESVAGNPNLRPGSPVPRKQTVLDVSQRFPADHADAANLQAHIHGQRAVFDVNKGDVTDTKPVLPMDYSHMDIEQVHYPKMRPMGSLVGEIGRRKAAPQSQDVELPFTAMARRRVGMY